MNKPLILKPLTTVVPFLFVLLNTGCPETQGEFVPVEIDQLRIVNVTLSSSRADLDEEVTITWDYEHPELLVNQRLLIISQSIINGIEAEPETPLAVTDRSFSFKFKVPVTVILSAEDADTVNDDSRIADEVAFDVLFNESNFFTVEFQNLVHADYPRLGNDGFGATTLHCSNFLGFYDPPDNENQVIDDFAPFAAVLPTDNAFYALTKSFDESLGFDLRMGSGYQPVSDTTPGAGFANAYAFASAIGYKGRPVPIKADDDDEFEGKGAIGSAALTFEPIFMCFSLLAGHKTGVVDVVDVQFGNLTQGLVVTLTSGFIMGLDPNRPRHISDDPSDPTDGIAISDTEEGTANGRIRGLIKTGILGQNVTDINKNLFDALVGISVQFDMPFLMDDAII